METAPQVKTQQSLLSKYWPLLMLGGIFALSVFGPEYLHNKYGSRSSGRSRRYSHLGVVSKRR